jgi:hypothetical protein
MANSQLIPAGIRSNNRPDSPQTRTKSAYFLIPVTVLTQGQGLAAAFCIDSFSCVTESAWLRQRKVFQGT